MVNPYPLMFSHILLIGDKPRVEEELPEWYRERKWEYSYFEEEQNWWDDSSNFHDPPFEETDTFFKDDNDQSYEVLGLKKSSSQEDIKKAFREKAMETHPDKGGSAEDFRDVREAYENLII